MASKRKNNPNQPELPIEGAPENGGKAKLAANQPPAEGKETNPKAASKSKPVRNSHADTNGNGNGETHVLAENVPAVAPARPFKPGKIELSLHRRVDRGFLD